jgi:hypothetical protein
MSRGTSANGDYPRRAANPDALLGEPAYARKSGTRIEKCASLLAVSCPRSARSLHQVVNCESDQSKARSQSAPLRPVTRGA